MMLHTLAAAGLLTLTACTGTALRDSWLDPSVKPDQRFKKIAVAVLSQDPSVRRTAEDALAARITRSEAVTSYSLLSASDAKDIERVKARLREAGVDGVVVMRMMGVDKETTWVPGSFPNSYYGFGGYWGQSYSAVNGPGSLQTDTIVQIETNVYSLADEKLVYAARSETFNPTGAEGLVREIAEAIAGDLKKRGLVP
jgi:hypothetical protein